MLRKCKFPIVNYQYNLIDLLIKDFPTVPCLFWLRKAHQSSADLFLICLLFLCFSHSKHPAARYGNL